MSGKIVFVVCILGFGAGVSWFVTQKQDGEGSFDLNPVSSDSGGQLVYVGDTQDRVYEMLGEPTIEFPEGDALMQWYAGYEISLMSNVVTSVRLKPVESEEERLERENRATLAENRLHETYQVVANQEEVSYNAWKDREEKRLQKERDERAAIEAYESRRAAERRAKIYAEAYRKSCGCRRGHHCRYCR